MLLLQYRCYLFYYFFYKTSFLATIIEQKVILSTKYKITSKSKLKYTFDKHINNQLKCTYIFVDKYLIIIDFES